MFVCFFARIGTGVIDAASIGAVGAISIVAHILASVIAFFSLLEFVNSILQWFGDRVGLSPPEYPPLSFEVSHAYQTEICELYRSTHVLVDMKV